MVVDAGMSSENGPGEVSQRVVRLLLFLSCKIRQMECRALDIEGTDLKV